MPCRLVVFSVLLLLPPIWSSEKLIAPNIEANQPAGFRPGYSTMDHIHTLDQVVEKHLEYNQPLYLAYIDYAKAFDSISHASIWQALIQQAYNDSKSLGIYGGHKVPIEAVPFMAMVWTTYGPHVGFCGGSIIHQSFILTAAHCLWSPSNSATVSSDKVRVAVGKSRTTDGRGDREVKKILCHENYVDDGHGSFNDICLLKLSKSLTFGTTVAPVELKFEILLEAGTQVNLTGWGMTESENGLQRDVLQVLVPIMSEEDCRRYHPHTNSSHLCTGSLNHGGCSGDSGSPLTLGNVLVGVFTSNIQCGIVSGGVYTSVASYLDWIVVTVLNNL